VTLRLALALALALTGACKRDGTRSGAERPRAKVPQRTATSPQGHPTIAGDPTPSRPLSEVFANAKWLRVAAPDSASGEPEVVDPPLVADDDGRFGRRVLAIKRAAFGAHVVREGDSAALDGDDVDELGLERPTHVYLVGAVRPCVATVGSTRAIVLDAFGRELELRHTMTGCGAGPHAPIGFVVERVPLQLGWTAARCDDDDARWTAAEAAVARTVESPARVGVVSFGEEPVLHVFAGTDALHVAIAAETGGPIVRRIPDRDAAALAACPSPTPD
jgi:hypothetical protein